MKDTSPLIAVSPGILSALVAAAMGGAVVFVPRDKELFARLMTDRQEDRVIEIASGGTASLPAPCPDRADSGTVLPAGVRADSGAAASPKALSAFHQIFSKFDFGALTEADAEALGSMLKHTEHPTECWETLLSGQRFHSLPSGLTVSLGDALAQSALAADKPALAAEIYSSVTKDRPAVPVEVLLRAVVAFRYTSAAAQALALLDEVESRQALTADQQHIQFELCQAAGTPARTFELIKHRLAEGPDLAKQGELLEALEGVADDSQRAGEMLTLWTDYLKRFPQYNLTPAELAKAGRDGAGDDRKLYGVWAWRIGQRCEWSGHFADALRLIMQASALGMEPALSRAESLANELNQETAYIDLLKAIMPLPGRDDLVLKLARGLAANFRYEAAAAQYQAYLSVQPKDPKVRYEMGCLYAERGEPEKAARQFALAAEGTPDDPEIYSRWAQALIRDRHYADALSVFRSMPEKAHTPATLENFRLLADSLNQPKDLLRAQRLALALKNPPEPADFLDLAEVEAECGYADAAIITLAQGRNAFPKSRALLLTSARMLRDRGQITDARILLARLDVKHDLEAACQLIEVCSDLNDAGTVLELFKTDLPSAHAWPPDVAVQLASLCATAGRTEEARELWLAAAREGSLHAANALTELADNASEFDNPNAWIMLGDALRGLGRDPEAQQAYEKSLQLIQEQAAANQDRLDQSQNSVPTAIH